MSNDLNKLTVAELRAEISGHPRVTTGDMTLPGLSRKRKSELVEILTGLIAESVTVPGGYNTAVAAVGTTDSQVNAYITDEALQDFVGSALSAANGIGKLGGAIEAFGTVLHEQLEAFTAAERIGLNEAKYQGRYAGKKVTVRVGRRTVHGTVVDRAHRDRDPQNRGNGKGLLLLAVKHDGRPRATLHNAEDVVTV